MTERTLGTTAGLQAKVRLRRAWFEAHPNQPIPEGRADVEALFLAIEAEARADRDAEVAALDVERLAEAMAVHEWAWLGWTDRERGHDDPRRMAAFRDAAAAIADVYADLAQPAPETEEQP